LRGICKAKTCWSQWKRWAWFR